MILPSLTLSAGGLRLTLLPGLGGAIGAFDRIEGEAMVPLLRGRACPQDVLETGCFPLVPFSNRVRDGQFTFRGATVRLAPNMRGDPSPLHGQGWTHAWTVESREPDGATLLFRHAPGEWPWRYLARQRVELDPRGLGIEISCINEDQRPMPCGLGFHPCFPCTPSTRLTTRAANVWTVDERVLPVDRIPADGKYDLSGGPICGRGLDNGYDGWSGQALIETAGAPLGLRLSSPDAHYFQLYSPKSGGLFVAEPVSHANAALNAPEEDWASLGLRVLASGEEMRLAMRLDVIPA